MNAFCGEIVGEEGAETARAAGHDGDFVGPVPAGGRGEEGEVVVGPFAEVLVEVFEKAGGEEPFQRCDQAGDVSGAEGLEELL